jgi:molybdopterin synthase sulfur carrier subunit
MHVKVKYFAMLREKAGKQEEIIQGEFRNLEELYLHLKDIYSFELPASMIQVAVNDEFAKLQSPLHDGASVVFIPPVAGG